MQEKLRITDSIAHFDKALALDPNFALAELNRANVSPTAKEFFEHLKKAVALADKVSDGERMLITARGPSLKVQLNGDQIIDIDLDRWTEAGKNPDGTKNKFKTALKDFKREGHIGFQDHGAEVAFRNVRLRAL